MSIYSVRTLTTDDELLEAAAWCRDRAEFAECQACGRTLATCRQHGDLPIYLHSIDGPYCAKCHAPEESDMTKKIDWAEEHDGKQLWEIARDWKEKGMTWGEVAETLGDEYGIEVTENGTSAAVHYRQTVAAERQAEPKRAEAAETPAPPAGEEAPAPAPEAPQGAAGVQGSHSEGYVSITRGGVSIDVSGNDFAEVREVAIRVLGGMRAIDAA